MLLHISLDIWYILGEDCYPLPTIPCLDNRSPDWKRIPYGGVIIPLSVLGDMAAGIWKGGLCNLGVLYHNVNRQLLINEEKAAQKKEKKRLKNQTMSPVKKAAAVGAGTILAGGAAYAAVKKGEFCKEIAQMAWEKLPSKGAYYQFAQMALKKLPSKDACYKFAKALFPSGSKS